MYTETHTNAQLKIFERTAWAPKSMQDDERNSTRGETLQQQKITCSALARERIQKSTEEACLFVFFLRGSRTEGINYMVLGIQ